MDIDSLRAYLISVYFQTKFNSRASKLNYFLINHLKCLSHKSPNGTSHLLYQTSKSIYLSMNRSRFSFFSYHNQVISSWFQQKHEILNTLRPRQNGRDFHDDIFKYIFFNENLWISLTISLKFVPKVRINNIPALVQIMAWRRPGDKPLSEPMMV